MGVGAAPDEAAPPSKAEAAIKSGTSTRRVHSEFDTPTPPFRPNRTGAATPRYDDVSVPGTNIRVPPSLEIALEALTGVFSTLLGVYLIVRWL
jgi:hypothetical protein